MDTIGKVAMKFLDRHENPEIIKGNVSNFEQELSSIIGTLNMRIETKEDGLLDLYLVM